MNLPFNSNIDFPSAVIQGMEPALHEQRPLEAEGGDQKVEAYSSKTVAFQKSHEETESNEDHDVDVLETWRSWQENSDTVMGSRSGGDVDKWMNELTWPWGTSWKINFKIMSF